MSRNFELLQQAGWDDEIFRESPLSRAAVREGTAARPEAQRSYPPRTRIGAGRTSRVAGQANWDIAHFVQRTFLDAGSGRPKAVLFCGVASGVTSSSTCAEISKILAEVSQKRVCALDANAQSPALHACFGVPNQTGLLDALAVARPAAGFARKVKEENCWLLTAGQRRTNKRPLGAMPGLEQRMKELRSDFDFVLIDAPPLGEGRDALVIGRMTEGVILVADPSGTSPGDAARTKRFLGAAGVPLLGVVMAQQSGLSNLLGRLMH